MIRPFLLLLPLAVAAAADPTWQPGRNQTILRERGDSGSLSSIRTIYSDVRTPFGTVLPAMGMDDWVQVLLSYDNRRRYYADLEDGDLGRRHDAGLLLRGYLWSRGVLEVEGHGESSQVADDVDASDISVRLAITVAQWRYAGVSIFAGTGLPVGSGKIPVYGHDADLTKLDYQLGMRATASAGFWVFHWNIDGGWDPNGVQVYPKGWTKDDVVLTTGEKQEVNTVHATSKLGVSWRPSRFFRVGGEGSLSYDSIEFEDERLTQPTAIIAGVVEVNPVDHLTITGHCGVQTTYPHVSERGAVVAGGTMLLRF